MRNLYLRLNIDSKASSQEIRNAIETCNNVSIKQDGVEVLLDSSRRNEYDIVHKTLDDIGAIRAHLGLNHGDNWRSPESDDFTKKPSHGLSLHDELILKIKRHNNKPMVEDSEFTLGDFFSLVIRLGLIAGFVIWLVNVANKSPSPSSEQKTISSRQQEPPFNQPALNPPLSGTIQKHVSSPGVAPLEIKTSVGSNYLVKLENATTGTKIIDVFIRGGSTIELMVPLGTYRLKYAAGQTWYGYEHYFGPSTGYSKADSNFRFYNDGNRVSGYTVTLYQVSNGNLKTSYLAPEEF